VTVPPAPTGEPGRPGRTLIEDLYAQAESRGGHPAIVYGEERVGFAELRDRVERLAAGLASRGIGAGDSVALILANSPAFVTSALAVSALGAVYVPLNPAFKQDEIDFCLRDCGVRAVIGDEPAVAVTRRIVEGRDDGIQLITTGEPARGAVSLDRLIEDHPGARLEPRSPGEDLVYQYSSGSTGRPKRVPRTHGQCWAEADAYAISMAIDPSDRLFCAIPLFHTYGQGNCLFTLVRTGATLVILEEPNPFNLRRGRALELLEQHAVTIFPGVPFNFRLLADLDARADLSALRLCYSAGSALPEPAFRGFLDRYGVAVRQLYGCTEAGVITINVDPDPVATAASVGTPAHGVTVQVVDEEDVPLAAGEVGEVTVRSPAQTRGYADMEELNREAFRDGSYYTGDLGRLDDEGRLFITGRKKLFIEVAGHKVDPIEVEDVLTAHPKVREAVVVGVRGRVEGEEVVKAAIVPRDGDCDQRELIEFCRQRLANFKVPQVVEFREEIPKSPLGKILRKYLIE
jgi:long-chain acyl-CoA synthetase